MTASPPNGPSDTLMRFLSRTRLSDEDRRALRQAVKDVCSVARGAPIREQGSAPQYLSIMVDGVARALRVLSDGRQQILAIFVAGDAMDCQSVVASASYGLYAMTDAIIARIPRDALTGFMRERPAVAYALWSESARQMAILQEWLLSLGRQSSYARLAHLICELAVRFGDAGLGDGLSYPLPLTQTDISDALGISPVHVNRVLQELRHAGLVSISHGSVHLMDRDALYRTAGFSPGYLGVGGIFE